jgi:O-methyltransferase involved in polyketide biosynthesis
VFVGGDIVMEKEKIILSKEKETLLIPLYCKALESKKQSPILYDKKALEMIDNIEYDFDKLDIPKQTYVTLCMRAKQFDEYVKRYLKTDPDSIVIHLGCGLDSRFDRVDNNRVEWYDLDFPEVIELRKDFFKETDRYHLIPSSVMELSWLDEIKKSKRPVIILAEGLFMYLKEEEIKILLHVFLKQFARSIILFDAFSEITAKGVKNHPSMKKTGATIHWGINHAENIETWNNGIHLEEEWYFSQSNEIKKLDFWYRLLFTVMNLFPIARKAHRIVVFRLEKQYKYF